MKFILDDIVIEHIENSDPISIKVGKVGCSHGYIDLEVNMLSISQANEALTIGRKPKSLKFGSALKGCKFKFSKQETKFYTGSMLWWCLPLSFRWEPLYCYEIKEVIRMIHYFKAL
ncbi:MAG: hypothetical protein ACPGTQ_15480 [Colwellia sp.]|uniref:hypothetical protein n=1 Tax=Pseudoalteromonas sp. SCSIO 43088 TaxID=2822846 RepID=UPI00202B7387|nr:hypothetical protein [Pseudoalteromonas sp. SCSIO 43088]URQ87409.1 hypothetical protein J8Z28_05860 [Pseudoalteromonas sp. SCSIO 43088]